MLAAIFLIRKLSNDIRLVFLPVSNAGLTEVYMPLLGGSCWLLNIGALQTDKGSPLPLFRGCMICSWAVS